MPWGLWIAVYFHGVGIAAGAFLVYAVAFLFGIRGFERPRGLQIASVLVMAIIAPALLAVALDLGHMSRAWRIVFAPGFTSMMAFNTYAYLILIVIAATVWFLARRPHSTWLRPVLILGAVVSAMVPSQSGAFFGVVDAKPYWHSALLPVMLLAGAVTAGAATLLIVRRWLGDEALFGFKTDRRRSHVAAGKLRIVVMIGLVVYVFLEFAEYSITMWNGRIDSPAIELVLFGPYWWVFWIIHLLFGVLIPILLLATSRRGLWVVASALVMVTMISSRLNVLVPGQAVGEIQGLQDAFVHSRLSYLYQATPMEYLVAFLCLALGMAIFAFGIYVTARVERVGTERTPS